MTQDPTHSRRAQLGQGRGARAQACRRRRRGGQACRPSSPRRSTQATRRPRPASRSARRPRRDRHPRVHGPAGARCPMPAPVPTPSRSTASRSSPGPATSSRCSSSSATRRSGPPARAAPVVMVNGQTVSGGQPVDLSAYTHAPGAAAAPELAAPARPRPAARRPVRPPARAAARSGSGRPAGRAAPARALQLQAGDLRPQRLRVLHPARWVSSRRSRCGPSTPWRSRPA